MENQIILAVDDSGKFLEYIPRMEGHTGQGKRHIGLTIILTNKKGQVLSQRRKHMVFDDVWCFTADTHTLHKEDGNDETLEEAANRCMKFEYNITEDIEFKNLGHFNYFGQDGKYCENEYCYFLVGEYNGDIKMNPNVGYGYKWLTKDKLLKDVEENPKKYGPWVKPGIELLKQKSFF